MNRVAAFVLLVLLAGRASAQIQVELKFPRVQYIAYEPLLATVKITNLAGRDIELREENGQPWFGFEVTANEGRFLAPNTREGEPPLRIESGKTVTRKINLTPNFPVQELGAYHVRANVYFADLNKFFYSQAKVVQVGEARPIWQRTVGVPEGTPGAGSVRTYSLLSNRFPDHTKLYVRVEDKTTGAVYNTFPLGRVIAFDDPQAELDQSNRLHVLHCAAPRTWSYAEVGLNGELLARQTFMETKSRPRLRRATDGGVAVKGGILDAPVQSKRASKLSARPPAVPLDD
ncbi:MAG: hypothetical protein H0T95_08865 [Chthoniobacterales bacterium]|nr:hypothetical protein [Chthoniobacterales bacterium]MBA3763663.1 hypothetical protein [Chthoniobacterales bacterium]